MALTLTPQDLIIDETAGLTDDDINPALSPHSTNTTLQYMLTLAAAGSGLSSPEVAYQADFVSVTSDAGETITSVVLAKDAAGSPFSNTAGVVTSIKTLDGKYVWLFQDPNNANVVIGVIGTTSNLPAAMPDLSVSYKVAFSLSLINTNTATPDLYAVQYVPLLNPVTSNPDDRIDLTNLVYASATGTTTVNFSQLSDAPPGHNNWYILDADAGGPLKILVTAKDGNTQSEVNVSTQGLGVASQDVREGRMLQIDLISGGTQSAGKNFTDTPLAPDYGSHVETISSAGFSVSQSTPTNTTADIEVHAYNNNDNAEGSGFPTDDNDTEIEITGVTFKLNGVPKTATELNISVDLTGTGLILHNVGEGVTVDFTTAGGATGTFDRFTIKNIDPDKDYFDVKEVHYSGGTSTPGSTEVGAFINFDDDGPTITVPFDAIPGGSVNSPETIANAINETADGSFGYNIGADQVAGAAYNLTTISDFVDADTGTNGVQIGLTGSVSNSADSSISQAVATLTAETASSATFNFSFHYDSNPILAGVQDATAGGTLVFDKDADTYRFTLTDVVDGYSFNVLHTADLVHKAPTGNTGHPKIVVEQLTPDGDDNPFFVQFTANSVTQQIGFGFNSTGDDAPVGDTEFNNEGKTHDLVTNLNEDWVSATRDTNGVAGDTIQKGEVLTLRFFNSDILSDVDPKAPGGGNEQIDPTALASGVVIKFDGIGNSEDLVLILDLKAADGTEITRAINVENGDLIKGNANIPFPYSGEFTLDNNDALLIIEQNDYTAAGETYQIQGIQIMQSSNGLTGTAIALNGAVGVNGGSSTTSGLTAWDPLDQDVLKIVDIGFVQQNSGTIGASLDFAFKLVDGDGDQTATQHILLDIGGGSGSSSSTLAASLSSFSAKTPGLVDDSGMLLSGSGGFMDPINHQYVMSDYLF